MLGSVESEFPPHPPSASLSLGQPSFSADSESVPTLLARRLKLQNQIPFKFLKNRENILYAHPLTKQQQITHQLSYGRPRHAVIAVNSE